MNGTLYVYLNKGMNLLNRDSGGKDLSDPFVKIWIKGYNKEKCLESKRIDDNLNPEWKEKFEFKMNNI